MNHISSKLIQLQTMYFGRVCHVVQKDQVQFCTVTLLETDQGVEVRCSWTISERTVVIWRSCYMKLHSLLKADYWTVENVGCQCAAAQLLLPRHSVTSRVSRTLRMIRVTLEKEFIQGYVAGTRLIELEDEEEDGLKNRGIDWAVD